MIKLYRGNIAKVFWSNMGRPEPKTDKAIDIAVKLTGLLPAKDKDKLVVP